MGKFGVVLVLIATVAMSAFPAVNGSKEEDKNMVYYHRVETLEVSANLSCVKDVSNRTITTVKYWILPNNFIVNPLSEGENVTVSADGKELYVSSVTNYTTGVYLCLMTLPNGATAYSRTDLYYKADLWKVYDKNVYVGFAAAAGVLILLGLMWLINRYWCSGAKRKSEKEETKSDKISDTTAPRNTVVATTSSGYNNPVYENEKQANGDDIQKAEEEEEEVQDIQREDPEPEPASPPQEVEVNMPADNLNDGNAGNEVNQMTSSDGDVDIKM